MRNGQNLRKFSNVQCQASLYVWVWEYMLLSGDAAYRGELHLARTGVRALGTEIISDLLEYEPTLTFTIGGENKAKQKAAGDTISPPSKQNTSSYHNIKSLIKVNSLEKRRSVPKVSPFTQSWARLIPETAGFRDNG